MARSESVVHRTTIRDVLRVSGQPEPNARGWFRCPVHADERPSAHIVGDRGWRCFACGAKGGIVALAVALDLGSDAATAMRALEARLL